MNALVMVVISFFLGYQQFNGKKHRRRPNLGGEQREAHGTADGGQELDTAGRLVVEDHHTEAVDENPRRRPLPPPL